METHLPEFEADPQRSLPWWRRRGFRVCTGLALMIASGLFWITQPMFPGSPKATPAVDPVALEADVRHLVEAFPGRSETRPEVLRAASDWIAQVLREAGGRAAFQEYAVGDRGYRNVRAFFGPEAGARLVVGAHYDACRGLPGADDNASGVAGLLALARSFRERPPAGPVELVAYTLEEPPHFRQSTMGSARHAAALRAEGAEVKAMLCLEMLGTYNDAPGSQRYPVPGLGLLYPDRGDFLVVVGDLASPRLVRKVKGAMAAASPLPVRSINAPSFVTGVDFSDHRSYWAAGIPAVMVTDTAFFRNPRYHTANDTPDMLDYPRMAQGLQGIRAAVDRLATGN